MKLSIIGLKSLSIIVLVIALSGCSSARKTTGSEIKVGKDEMVSFDGSVIKDPVSNFIWSYFYDNPTSYFRYKLDNTGNFSKLPTMDQMLAFLEKIRYQINLKKDPGNLTAAKWFDIDCDFLTSTSIRTNEGEIYYEVAHWDAASKSVKKGKVTGGDLVYLLLLNEK